MTAAPPPGSDQPSPGPAGPVEPPQRVRVVLADAARARRSAPTRAELEEQSQIGEALVRGLVRTQLALALRLAAVVAVGLGGLPLLFAVAPTVARVRPFGIALPWLLLGVVAYPFLLVVGAAYVYLAERTEREFTELVERPDK
jgi:hypothetical protein